MKTDEDEFKDYLKDRILEVEERVVAIAKRIDDMEALLEKIARGMGISPYG